MFKTGVNGFKLNPQEVETITSKLAGKVQLTEGDSVKDAFNKMVDFIGKHDGKPVEPVIQQVEVEKIVEKEVIKEVEKIIEKIPAGHVAVPVTDLMKKAHTTRSRIRRDYTMERMVTEAIKFCAENPEGSLFTKKW